MSHARVFFLSLLLVAPHMSSVFAAPVEGLPTAVMSALNAPLRQVGSATFRKFGFKIYDVTLWSPHGVFDETMPYALELKYARSLSKDTVVGAVTDDIRDQTNADEATLDRWNELLNDALPAVEEDDTLVGLAIPGKKSQLFYNNNRIAELPDQELSKAFFDIWLGKKADPSMRQELTGLSE